jgi:ATP-dependent DNA helicase RecG
MDRERSSREVPEQMTEGEFWDRFGRVEHAGLDFKRGVSPGMLDAVPAMAMTSGGLIVHGVTDDRTIVGCPLSQNTLDRISQYAHQCDVPVDVRAVRVEGSELTITTVPEVSGRIVTTPDGRLLRRIGGDSQPIRGDALGRFVRARLEHSGEDEVLQESAAANFDLTALNRALAADGRRRVRLPELPRALVDLTVAVPGESTAGIRILAAAAVLFSADPRAHISRAAVQLVRRTGVGPGPGPTRARAEVAGPLDTVAEQCLAFIAEHTGRHETVSGLRRESVPEYPEEVVREAVVNALAHRDYGLVGSTVDITIWDDRLEVTSPGALPGHITVDNMRAEHYSRNPRIMRVLKTLGLVEEYGDGVDRMIREMDSRLLEPPLFSATPDSVTVTLRNRMLVDIEDQVWLRLLTDIPMTTGERRALVVANREGGVTPRRLRELLPETDVSAILAAATAKGLLDRTGTRGGSRYVLSDEVIMRAGSTAIGARNRRQQQLLERIRRRGSISVVEGAHLLDTSMQVVRDLLNGLVEAGAVRAEGRTRGRRYYAAD